MFSNTLTLLNSLLLFMTGLLTVLVVSAHSVAVQADKLLWLGVIVLVGVVFLGVQGAEYCHLYWCIFCAGSCMMFFVVTGLHGGHVFIGCVLQCGYWLLLH